MFIEHGLEIHEKLLVDILVFAAKNHFTAELRTTIYQYLSTTKLETSSLIETINFNIPRGSNRVFYLSLVKDLIYFYSSMTNNSSYENSQFILDIARALNISLEEIKFMEMVCNYDKQILDNNIEDSTIIKNMKDLAQKARAVNIPISSIVISGNSIGLSAQQVVTGFSALGLGSCLGLASVTTHISLLVGITSWYLYLIHEQRKKSTYRKRMILQILAMYNKALINLVQDINIISRKIELCVEKEVIDKQAIQNLTRKLTLLTNVTVTLREKARNLESREIDNRGDIRLFSEPDHQS